MKRIILLAIALTANSLFAQPAKVADGTAEGTKAIAKFKVPAGFKVDLWAAEPMLGNPVAFCIDEKGRIFVAESYRFNRGTEEYRHRPFFLDGDLANTSVDDRLAMYKKFEAKFPDGMKYFTKYADKIRLLEDRAGQGKADFSSIFADGFNDPLDGLAAGVLAKDGDVYFTCIPKLWKLRDTKNTGKADQKIALHHGFGPQTAFLGHDLHGLAFGPDGKLYFSVGDRGYHVKNHEGRTLSGPRNGAVFRCDPDGANLEVVHTGLRNPQELAFDQFGNLFAADNNCDKGDHSRLVYIVEGGHSGWNMAYQTIETPGFRPLGQGEKPSYLTGPWHAEKLWHMQHPGQAAYILPAVGKLGAGPGGFAFTSGLGWPKRYHDSFFMCNFTGNGGIDSFRVVPKGAAYDLVDYHTFINPVSATDVEFGYDGKMYLSDWVQFVWDGGGVGKGRIFSAYDPKTTGDATIRDMGKLMKVGFKKQDDKALLALLAHPDQRVRLRAQYELAERWPKVGWLYGIATARENGSKEIVPRLHAIWAIGQMARKHPGAIISLISYPKLLDDPQAEIRGQAVKVLGDIGWKENTWPGLAMQSQLLALIEDPHPRVRFFAMQSAGKLKLKEALPRILAQVQINKDEDTYLRHAAVTAIGRIGEIDAVLEQIKLGEEGKTWGPLSNESKRALHLAAVLVLRNLNDKRIARFLNDGDDLVVTEAARAINDLPISDAMPALAKLAPRYAPRKQQPDSALWRRIINANYRLGQAEHVTTLLDVAQSTAVPDEMRFESLACVHQWSDPGNRDRVNGYWRPLPARDVLVVRAKLQERLPALLTSASSKMQAELTKMIATFTLNIDEQTIIAWIDDEKRPVETRLAAMDLVASRYGKSLESVLTKAYASGNAGLRSHAREHMIQIDPKKANQWLDDAWMSGSIREKQHLVRMLARRSEPQLRKRLATIFAAFEKGVTPTELHLDIIEAAKSADAPLWTKFEETRKLARTPEARLKVYDVTLKGGDAARGRQIFVSHAVAQCVRCHKAEGQGGDAGPDLSVWAPKAKGDRGHLLESLLYPSRKFTPGFGAVSLTMLDGRVLTGTVKLEDKEKIVLADAAGKTQTITVKEIDERANGISPMPEVGPVLSMEEIRDLVEYLATLKE